MLKCVTTSSFKQTFTYILIPDMAKTGVDVQFEMSDLKSFKLLASCTEINFSLDMIDLILHRYSEK